VNAMNLIAIFLYACAFYFIRQRTQDESNLVAEPVHST
jgi:hypothetical protein